METENGLFVTDYQGLVENSWKILNRTQKEVTEQCHQ
jgi:hypothetical protein